MSEHRDNLMPDYGEYDLAVVLDEYRKATAAHAAESALKTASQKEKAASAAPKEEKAVSAVPKEEAPAPAAPAAARRDESIADRSRRIVMDALGETLRQYRQNSDLNPSHETPQEAKAPVANDVSSTPDTDPEAAPAEEATARPEETEPDPDEVPAAEAEAEPNDSPEPIPIRKKRRVPRRETPAAEAPQPEEEPEEEPEEYPEEEPAEPRVPLTRRISDGAQAFTERFLTPAVRMIATRLAQRQMQRAEAANWPDPVDIRETRELTPVKAGKYYTALLKPLRLRCRIAAILCVLLAWISLGMPMTGMLRVSLPLEAGVSVLLTLAVMIAALDVVTAGLRQLADMRPGAEALAVLAALLSCLDGLLVLFGRGTSLPFCVIGAVALTFALWGERLTCTALRRTFHTAASSKNPTVLSSEIIGSHDTACLMRTDRGTTEGIVRRSESQSMCETAYATAAPFLIGAAFLLSIVASMGGQGQYFLHTLSALLSVSASFAAFISFPLPYALASRRLRSSGAALAGFQGCADIGKTRRIVITDEDLFPPGTMRFSEINVQEGVFLGKVVSSAASLLCASGSGVSSLFRELVDRRGYHIPNPDQFLIHEGGGLSGIVGGEKVLVGSAGFMNLMGIRLPQNLQSKNAICTAISGELVGVFVIEYIPVTSVQDALVTLLRGRTQTIFAIRDFNITPLMIRQLFRMPTDNFNFPSFRDRYRIGEELGAGESPVSAVVTRGGMLPMVEAAETGRRLYGTCRISTVLSLLGTVIGMVIMFLLCRAGSFDTANVGNVLSFMLLWALPVVILSVGQNRR